MLLAANSLGSVSCSGWSLRGLLFLSVHAKNAQSDMYSVEAGSLLRDLCLLSPAAAITAVSSVSSVILLGESVAIGGCCSHLGGCARSATVFKSVINEAMRTGSKFHKR